MRFAAPQQRRSTRPRASAARRTSTQLALERSAELAASRVTAGARGLVRDVGRAPAARADVPGSPGAPLPDSLRARLEPAFGADLSAVRIHTDAAASRAARDAGARAFAAGPHVYLDLPAHALVGDRGFELLAHEVAHVLQQTARPGPDGALRVTPLLGSGPIQHASEAAVDAIDFWEDTTIDYPKIKARYEEEYSDKDAELKKAFLEVESTVGSSFRPKPPDTSTKALLKNVLGVGEKDPKVASATLKTFDALPERVRGFYLDCFKALEQFDAARTILDRGGRDVRTSFASRSFYLSYRGTKLDWLIETLGRPQRTTKPERMVLSTLFFTNWVNTYPPFLLTPSARWMYDLSIQGGSFQKSAAEVFTKTSKSTALHENELFLVALKALQLLDKKRNEWLPDLAKKALETHPDLPRYEVRKRLAKLLAGDADVKDWETDSGTLMETTFSPEQIKMLEQLRPKVKQKAIEARDFWEAVDEQAGGTRIPLEELNASLRADKRAKTFEAHLVSMAKSLFKEKAGKSRYDFLPKPAEYAALVSSAIGNLKEHVYASYELPLIRLAAAGKLDSPEALRLGWFIRAANFVDKRLRTYDKAKDSGFSRVTIKEGKKDVEKLLPDHRVGHRIRMAYLLSNISAVLQAKKLDPLIAKVLEPIDTQIALDGEWQESKDVRLGDMSRELGAGSVPGNLSKTKITVGLIERFLFADYYRQLTKKLETLLVERKGVYTDKKNPILTDAVRAVASWPKPERWIMPGSELIEGSKPTIDNVDLILNHPRVREGVLQGRDTFFIATDESVRLHRYGVVVWAIPRMDQMVKLLRAIPGLDGVVKSQWKAVHGEEMPETLTYPLDWLKVVEKLAEAGTLVGGKTIDVLIREQILADYEKAVKGDPKNPDPQLRAGLHDAARRATSHQRRVHEETRIIPHWNAYDRYDIAKMFEPREAVRWMIDFTGFIMPDEDRPAQMAAMVIEVADRMGGPMDNDLRDIPIPQLLPLISGTLRVWAEEKDPRYRARVIAIRRDDFTEDKLTANVEKLKKQEKKLKDWIKSHQLDYGLIGEAGSNTLRAINETYHVKAGYDNSFIFEGVRYELVKVHKSFRWHTDYPLGLAGGVEWPGEDTTGRAFLVDEKKQKVAPTGAFLFTIKIGETYYDVKDTDTRLLGRVQHAAAMYSILKGLRQLAKALDKFGKAIMRAAEWFPPTAAPARVARIAATVLETLGSDEFKELLDAFSKDGVGAIRKYVDKAVDFFHPPSPVEVVLWLLFDTVDRKFDMGKHGTDRQRQVGRRKGIWSRVAAIARNILHLGKRMLARMQRLRIHAQAPVRRGHLWIVSHPGAALIVRYILLNFERLSALQFEELLGGGGVEPSKEKSWKTTIQDGIKEGVNGILEHGAEMLNTLAHLELPHELVQLETVIEFVIDTIIDRLGFEYQIGYEAMKSILSELDVWQDGLKEIAGALKAGGIDPNVLWRDLIRDKINPALVEVRDKFVADLKKNLSEVPFLSKMVEDPKAASEPIEAQTEGAGFPEQEDQPDTDTFAAEGVPSAEEALSGPPPPSSFGAGAPLPAATRAGAELRLGHDLSHVRVHAGSDAAAMTGAYHAEGVTTGSHVFLRPGLSTETSFGDRVLHHELAHVVQQTGPRPLGGSHSATPSIGEPGRGLHVDPSREAAAERAAAGGGAPLAGGAAGVQPFGDNFGSDFFRRLLKELSTDKSIRDNMLEIDKGKSGAKILEHELAEDEASKKVAAALSAKGTDSLVKAITSMTEKSFTAPPFNVPAVASMIVKYIADNQPKKDEIENAIPVLVYKARRDHKTKKGKDGPVKTFYYVPPNALELELSDYLFAKTGVAIKVQLNEEKGEHELKRKDVVKSSKPIRSIKAGYLHLPFIGSTAALWDAVIDNTFKNSPTIKTKFATTKEATAEYKAATRLVLSRLGPRPGVYDKKAKVLKLSDAVAKAVEAEVHPPKDLPADKLPPVKDYIKTNHVDEGTKVDADPAYGHLGLRLGTYDEYGPGGPQKGFEREAHHTTQYLLLEYFRNMHKTSSPFPVKSKISAGYYPGVDGSASGVVTIKRPGATSGIAVEKFEKKRGGEMPTILISKHTHRSDVHIHAEPDETEGLSSKSTPAQAVDNKFYGALGRDPRAWKTFFMDEKQLKKLKDPGAKVSVERPELDAPAVGNRIFVAACKTYQWMWKEMRDKLKAGLEEKEVEYYNAVAEVGKLPKSTHEMKASDLKRPYELAVKWNEEKMETGGAGFDPNA